jgi:hypothetical protein
MTHAGFGFGFGFGFAKNYCLNAGAGAPIPVPDNGSVAVQIIETEPSVLAWISPEPPVNARVPFKSVIDPLVAIVPDPTNVPPPPSVQFVMTPVRLKEPVTGAEFIG